MCLNLVLKIRHDVLIQACAIYIVVKKFNSTVGNDLLKILRTKTFGCPEAEGVIFEGLGVQMMPRCPAG